jgi:hypothetical protein
VFPTDSASRVIAAAFASTWAKLTGFVSR